MVSPEISDWVEFLKYMFNEATTKRQVIKRDIYLDNRDAAVTSWTSMVYPLSPNLGVQQQLQSDTSDVYLLGCKNVLDATQFEDADLMQKLNSSLKLWMHGCPESSDKFTLSGGFSPWYVVLGLLFLGMLGVVGYLLYMKFIG